MLQQQQQKHIHCSPNAIFILKKTNAFKMENQRFSVVLLFKFLSAINFLYEVRLPLRCEVKSHKTVLFSSLLVSSVNQGPHSHWAKGGYSPLWNRSAVPGVNSQTDISSTSSYKKWNSINGFWISTKTDEIKTEQSGWSLRWFEPSEQVYWLTTSPSTHLLALRGRTTVGG